MDWWFKCPSCKQLGLVDDDQADGRVSIQCDCGFHETGRVEPKVSAYDAVNRLSFETKLVKP